MKKYTTIRVTEDNQKALNQLAREISSEDQREVSVNEVITQILETKTRILEKIEKINAKKLAE